MQCAWTVLYGHLLSCPALPHFSTLSHKRHDFRKKKKVEHKMCVLISLQFCLKHFSFSVEQSEIWSAMYIGLHEKYRLFLSDLNETKKCSTEFRKILKYQIWWKSVQWQPSCSVRTDGRTDTTRLTVAVLNFANAPNNCIFQRYKRCHKPDTEHLPVQTDHSLLRDDGALLHHQYCENLKSQFDVFSTVHHSIELLH